MDAEQAVITGESQEKVTEPENQELEKATEPTQEKTEPKPESKVPAGVQKKINKLTAKNYALEEQLKQERLKNQDLNKEPEAPDPERFMNEYGKFDRNAYSQAVNDYNTRRDAWKETRVSAEKADNLSAQEMMEHQGRFVEKGAKLAEKYPDWWEILNKQGVFSPDLTGYLWSTENVELALYLGKHEEEARRIGAVGRDRGIDAMEAELEAIEARMKTPLRNAGEPPPPISPVNDSTLINIRKLNEIKDPDEWHKEWQRQQYKDLGYK